MYGRNLRITYIPKFLEILAEAIVSYSGDVQFFIGTHSLDLLTYVLEKAEKSKKLKEINIIRLHYREDTKTVEAEVMVDYLQKMK